LTISEIYKKKKQITIDKVTHPDCYGIVLIFEKNNTFDKELDWTFTKTLVGTKPDME
jgi:hypothetical protein